MQEGGHTAQLGIPARFDFAFGCGSSYANTASAALRGSTGIDERLRRIDPAQWCISAVTRAELRYGLALKPEATKLAQYVEAFLMATTTAPWDQAAADSHGMLRARLRRAGTPIGGFDEMIATHALSLGAVLVTDNARHFRLVDGLATENWIRSNRGDELEVQCARSG